MAELAFQLGNLGTDTRLTDVFTSGRGSERTLLDNADDCIAGLAGMSQIVTDIVVCSRVANDHDVITWFDLQTTTAGPTPTANWAHINDGLITSVNVTFDPRELVGSAS